MPKPENFEKLTPDQKREARLQAWINHEGIEFTDPAAEKGTDEKEYNRKYNRGYDVKHENVVAVQEKIEDNIN